DNWHDLDTCWSRRFLQEAKNILDPTSFEILKRKDTKQNRGNEKKDKTELEILSKIPPSIHYPKLDKSTTTTSSRSARTPFRVESWTSFIERVPNEEDVRGALKNNILDNLNIISTSKTTDRGIQENFERRQHLKTLWVLNINDEESLDERYEKDLRKKKTVKSLLQILA
ncbi:7148_t:CDS:2, partial [Gigaspora margarita]